MNTRKISKLVYSLILLAFLAFAMFILMGINNIIQDRLDGIDSQQQVYAEHQARIEYQKSMRAFSAVFDTETKRFVDKKKARTTVKPYGMSGDCRGKYLFVIVDDKGDISSEWIYP